MSKSQPHRVPRQQLRADGCAMEWYKSTAEGSTCEAEQQRSRTTSAASRQARALRLHPKRIARAKAIRSIQPPRELHLPHVSPKDLSGAVAGSTQPWTGAWESPIGPLLLIGPCPIRSLKASMYVMQIKQRRVHVSDSDEYTSDLSGPKNI